MTCRSRTTPPTPPYPYPSLTEIQPVNFDPTHLNAALDLIAGDPEHGGYILDALKLLDESEQFKQLKAKIIATEAKEERKVELAFALGLLCGGGCAIEALEQGYLGDGGDEEGEGKET